VAGRYRALLIGNSTYPADEHNLQTLKGPVKDIAALNRALIDPGTGLFADVDVTLLPEATSARVIRALGRFFGTAARDDVLLVYFSGHGKLDQSGRLHLCMQDTESGELLSTAVSSARIKEFADASRARNVVIVLDCCYAGAFRGGDVGEAVAGPGRYVLTSCRGTQLANDATVENGTSLFTQYLVDGLLGAAADQDRDGYVTFSDLYAYVDRRLREVGKQIPQRRVDGDGDVHLAKRPLPTPAGVTAAMQRPSGYAATTTHTGQPQQPGPRAPPGPTAADDGTAAQETTPAPAGPRPRSRRRGVVFAAFAAAVAVVGGAIATVMLLTDGSGSGSGGNPGSTANVGATSQGTFSENGPWRLRVTDDIPGNDPNGPNGCTITLTDTHSGRQILPPVSVYQTNPLKNVSGTGMLQFYQAGSFRWQANDPGCLVVPMAGSGAGMLPFVLSTGGDSDAFMAPPGGVAVQMTKNNGSSSCQVAIRDPANGQVIDSKMITSGQNNDTVVLDNASGHRTVYLANSTATNCEVRVSAAP
jgi:Caspase domain